MVKKCIKCNISVAQTKKRPYCKPCRNKIERQNYNPVADKFRHLKYIYGLTREKYEQMFLEQKHLCAICGNDLRLEKKVNVDHDHATGKVRAILCVRCNLSVGLIEDTKWIKKALKYLKKHK